MQSYTTQPFRGTPSKFVRRVAAMWLGRWWWAVTIPVVACCILAINEAVWIFVALMLVFLLYPGLTLFIYINYAFSPEAQHSLYEQTVTVDEKSIKITYTEKNNIISYSVNDISGIEYNSDHVLVKLKKPRYNHISIPLSAIEKTEQQSFFDMLAKFDQTVA